ncbi:duf4419 domain protein [Fusarium longipes]|uniref:Duf4419 domain protein n=1 Tax=Fusarium longipes TaxID=694270 RepID=A0A395TA80_9HYPO|nr:duf4419 domain protein [Fusarium longipes]
MPVTFSVVDHPAKGWETPKVETTKQLLMETSPREYRRCLRIIGSSFSPSLFQNNHISPSENGFVWSAYHAYSGHHHLTIRPEDVWFAILTQLTFFINANAEELRSFFVSHDGQKELEVIEVGTLDSVDIGALAQRLAGLVSKNVKDPELGDWVMPNFSTTTDTDRVVASVLFMGAMQKYFSFAMSMTCGIPSVTLMGEISDWQAILARLDRLDQLGKEPAEFAEMLKPILEHMILSLEKPDDANVIRFWNTIATRNSRSSGTPYITGWITAFCFWDDKGRAKKRHVKSVLDGVMYPSVSIDRVTVGVASVPVKINDNGNIISSKMVAGSFGIQASTMTQDRTSPGSSSSVSELNSVQPLSGWLMYEEEAMEAIEARAQKRKALYAELAEVRKLSSEPNGFLNAEQRQKTGLIMEKLRALN